MTVYRSQVAVLISPLVPYRDTVVLEIFDVRISCYEPEKFIYDRLEMNLLGGKKRKTLAEIETHLVAEYALSAGSCTVAFHGSVFTDMTQEV